MSETSKSALDLAGANVGGEVSRRQFIRGGLVLGLSLTSVSSLLAACTQLGIPGASAPAADLSVLAWGGSYGDALRKFISDPFAQAHGDRVLVQEQAVAEQSLAKLKAEVSQPTIDVWLTTSSLPSDLAKLGGLWELTPDKIPNLANIVPATNQMYQGKVYGAGIHLNTKTITVDKTRIKTLIPDYDISMLNDWEFIWRPELFNQISLNSFQSNFGLLNMAMTIHRGGSQQNEDAWFKALRELAPNVHTEIGTSGGIGQLQLFQSKEVMVAANNMTDAQQLLKNGIQVDIGYPQNPLVPILDYVVAIKNGPAGQTLAFDFINRMLDAKTMPDYDAAIGNYHTNSKAQQPTLTGLPPLSPEALMKTLSFDLDLAESRFDAVFARYQKEIIPLFGKKS